MGPFQRQKINEAVSEVEAANSNLVVALNETAQSRNRSLEWRQHALTYTSVHFAVLTAAIVPVWMVLAAIIVGSMLPPALPLLAPLQGRHWAHDSVPRPGIAYNQKNE